MAFVKCECLTKSRTEQRSCSVCGGVGQVYVPKKGKRRPWEPDRLTGGTFVYRPITVSRRQQQQVEAALAAAESMLRSASSWDGFTYYTWGGQSRSTDENTNNGG